MAPKCASRLLPHVRQARTAFNVYGYMNAQMAEHTAIETNSMVDIVKRKKCEDKKTDRSERRRLLWSSCTIGERLPVALPWQISSKDLRVREAAGCKRERCSLFLWRNQKLLAYQSFSKRYQELADATGNKGVCVDNIFVRI